MACRRLGIKTVAACDVDNVAKMKFNTHLAFDSVPFFDSVIAMGTERKALRKATLVTCGFPCGPFSKENTQGAATGCSARDGRVFLDMVETLVKRADAGAADDALLFENVDGFLNAAGPMKWLDKLTEAGLHWRVYIVSAQFFDCATKRQRLIGVCFRDAAALERFEAPLAITATCRPMSSVLQAAFNDAETFPDLFLSKQIVHFAARSKERGGKGVPIVGRRAKCGMRTVTSAYAPPRSQNAKDVNNSGTLLCIKAEFDGQTERLDDKAVDRLCDSDAPLVRKLHPKEIFSAYSWTKEEMAAAGVGGNYDADAYQAAANTICLSVFEAFAARMLKAMGKPEPDAEREKRLPAAETRPRSRYVQKERGGVKFWELTVV